MAVQCGGLGQGKSPLGSHSRCGAGTDSFTAGERGQVQAESTSLALKGKHLEKLTLVPWVCHRLRPQAGPATVPVRGKGLGVLTKGSQAAVYPGVKPQL